MNQPIEMKLTFRETAMVVGLGMVALCAPAHAEREFTLLPSGASYFSTLEALPERDWYRANYSVQDPDHHYETGFSRDYIISLRDRIQLRIDRTESPPNKTTGAALQLRGRRGYGRYEVVMKPARGEGLVSSFFTWTGPYKDTPHDEIDIEFLGKDTTRVSLNVFTGGQALIPPKEVKLPFDAAESFNLYAFEWTPEAIHWYVNRTRVFSVYAYDQKLPTHPGIITANIWTGSPAQWAWHGEPRFEDGATSDYKCISFQALGDSKSKQCSDEFFPTHLSSLP